MAQGTSPLKMARFIVSRFSGLFNNITTALLERKRVVVSKSYDFLYKGDDCLDGQLDVWMENPPDWFKEFELVYKGKTKTLSAVYELRRKYK